MKVELTEDEINLISDALYKTSGLEDSKERLQLRRQLCDQLEESRQSVIAIIIEEKHRHESDDNDDDTIYFIPVDANNRSKIEQTVTSIVRSVFDGNNQHYCMFGRIQDLLKEHGLSTYAESGRVVSTFRIWCHWNWDRAYTIEATLPTGRKLIEEDY